LKYFLALLSLSYLGAALCVWVLSGIVPWFLLPDFPFLSIVFAGLFVPGLTGFLCAIPPALIREITTCAPSWSMLLGSMALYFAAREIGRRFLLRDEPALLAAVISLLAAESLSVVLLLSLAGSNPFSRLDFPHRRSPVPGPVEQVAPGEGLNQRIRKREQDPDVTRRARILLFVAIGGFVLIVVRLYWLQVVSHDLYRALSENNRLRLRTVHAPRGPIFDRKGRPIAETQGSFDLVCSPVDVVDPAGEIRLLSEIVEFDTDEGEILEKVREAMKKNPYSGLTVARDLRFEQVSVLEFNREALPGFSVMVEAKRSYPFGTAFAHVLGYVGEVSQDELDASGDERLAMGDIVGKYGLERMMDNVLRGINGGRKVEVDAAGRDQRMVEEVPSTTGGPLYTTLDADLQKAAQEAMGERAGAVIALVPKTGEVLAFYSAPGFDPNVFARGIRKGDWQALNSDPRKPMQNKGLQGTYAPGSTVKPFLALAALEGKALDKSATVSCGGSYRLGNRTFRCWKEKGHGTVDMYRALIHSCDVYFYSLGIRLGPERIPRE
jgi:penicillin-binding protein 2